MRSFFRKGSPSADAEGTTVDREPSGATILIVDDSPTEIHVLTRMLEKAGYKVVSAENGEAGVEEARRIRPDLVLMDVVMPGLNGFQATRKLSSDPETASIPIIMVTTKDQETDRAWGLRQGAREYLVKPVSSGELLTKVRNALAP